MLKLTPEMDLGWKKQWLVLLGAIVLVGQILGSGGCFQEEKRVLLDFKATYSKESLVPSWVNDPKSNCCAWERVTCDSSSGHVIGLSLQGLSANFSRGVYGDSSPICFSYKFLALNWSMFLHFKDLRSLNLSNNCFDRFIPKGDYKNKSTLKKLKTLDLSSNFFDKSILELVSALPSLENLDLAGNIIDGPFPIKELSLLRNLEQLDLSSNRLYSPFTTKDHRSKSTLKKLKRLDLSVNYFSKSIVELISALPSLENLALSSNPIGGHFPMKVLANLSNLEVLKLSAVSHDGSFPNEGLCKMKKLQELDLSANLFKGTLDICLGNLTSLRNLDISYNSLTGSIPRPLIARLTSLEYLSLSFNKFEGLFSLNVLANHSKLKGLYLNCMYSESFLVETENPPWIAPFQLEHLEISNCQVNLPTKIIPTFLSYQNDLKYIDLSSNSLVGTFPNWLFMNKPNLEVLFLSNNSFIEPFELPFGLNHQMDQLYELRLSNNQIQGELPNNIGFLFPQLQYFDVSNNMFGGHIPVSIGQMSRLFGLFLGNNNFSGKVPEQIFNGCISLNYLVMDNNQLNGTLLDGIGNLRLQILSASRNNFEGPITKEICQLELEILDLSHNNFFGTLPSCFKMPVISLFLQGNNLIGKIPERAASESKYEMWAIDLSDNKFTGTILKSIYGFSQLKFLLLAGNQLHGRLSIHICQLKNIDILDLSRNNFTGFIPFCFNNMLFGTKDPLLLDRYEGFPLTNSLNGPYKSSNDFAEVQFVTKSLSLSYKGNILLDMSALDLSFNQLTGEIPHEIGDLHALHALNLSHNYLNGPIPESFKQLEGIESLDLSNNNLSGEIPLQLQDLPSLSVFNVSYNNLSGRAPDKGQFGTFDENSYRGNPYLTWSNSNRGNTTLPPPPVQLNEKNNSIIDFTAFYWSFATSYVMILLVLVAILWINPYWRRAWLYFVEECLLKFFGQFLEDAFY